MQARTVVSVIGLLVIVCSHVVAQTVSFSFVFTEPDLGRLDRVLAVADFDGDGRDDILAGGILDYSSGLSAEDRLTKATLRLLRGEADGTFTHAPELVDGVIEARQAVAVADDFNGDGRIDLAVFDAGVYVNEQSIGYGNPPQLFLSSHDGVLRPSSALADAVRAEHEARPYEVQSPDPADLHLKSATSGDVDIDGDIDFWLQSGGGANVEEHIMVNNGDGTFTIDRDRTPKPVLHNWPDEYWGYHAGHFVDVDNDGDLDLALGQLGREAEGTAANSYSVVMMNDGTGNYPWRIELPYAELNDSYTSVPGITHFDVNSDGWQDLLLSHRRNDRTGTGELPFTGRYIQVLINRDDGTSFGDETSTWMGDQSATTSERKPNGNPLHNSGLLEMHDIDRDGCADLVISDGKAEIAVEAPLVYRNNGSGQFEALPPEPFLQPYVSGNLAVPADVNGDSVFDIVIPQLMLGPDNEYGTDDDSTELVTVLNITPAGSVRCSPRG